MRKRKELFDLNRNLDLAEEMAEQQQQGIEALRQTLQQLQSQHEQEIQSLRQRIEASPVLPTHLFQMTADQILHKLQGIKTFCGRDDYPLQEFICAVESVATLCGNNQPLLLHELLIFFKEKIQGEARKAIQHLGGELTWQKAELITYFPPRRSYKQLMDECRNIKVLNLRELFNIISSIKFGLNELYEFDSNKPTNYSLDNDDKNLVDVEKNMITGSYRTIITTNMTLIEMFKKFGDLGLLGEYEVIHYQCRKGNRELKTKYTLLLPNTKHNRPEQKQINSSKQFTK